MPVKYLSHTTKSLSLSLLNKQGDLMSIFGILFLLIFGYVIIDIIRSIKLDNPNNKENK